MKGRKTVALLRAALLVAFVSGCAGSPPFPGPSSQPGPSQTESRKDPPRVVNRNLSGYSPAFKQGYVAGCDSAESSIRRRDEGRYKSELDYAMGWNDGYSVCRR